MQVKLKFNYVGETFSPVLESKVALNLEGETNIHVREITAIDAPLVFTLHFAYKKRQFVRVLNGEYY